MGYVTMNHCLSEDQLEDYHFKRLEGEALDAVEEHLLVCEHCQRRLEEEEEIASDIKFALREFNPSEEPIVMRPAPTPALSQWRAWALATAAALLVCVGALTWNAARPHEFQVALRVERGVEIASAPSGPDLTLTAQMQELPQLERFHAVLVSDRGSKLESADLPPAGGILVWRLERGLPPGTYWVRLSDPNRPDRVLREFGLKVRW